METKLEIAEYIKQKLREHKDSGKTYGGIAASTKLDTSTITRYASDEAPSSPRGMVASKILSYFHSKAEVMDILSPAYDQWIKKYGSNIDIGENKAWVKEHELAISKYHERMYSFIHFKQKMSSDEFLEEFGKQGKEIVSDLIDEGFIKYENNHYMLGDVQDLSNPNVLVPMVKTQLDAIEAKELGKSILLWHNREGLPEHSFKRVAKASIAYVKEVREAVKEARISSEPITHYVKSNIFVDWSLNKEGEDKNV